MRIIVLLFSFFVLSSLFLWNVWAQCTLDASSPVEFLKWCAAEGSDNAVSIQGGETDIKGINALVQRVAKQAIGFGALFAIGFIVFAGIRYTTAYGDDEKIKHAKTTAIYAIIGLLILGLSFVSVDTIVKFIFQVAEWGNN